MKLALTLLAGIVFASAGLTGCASKPKSCSVADGKSTTACCPTKKGN